MFGKKRGKNGKRPGPPAHDDLVERQFSADRPNQLWLTDITEHPTGQGKLYLCAIKDVWSNRIVGYSISDRMKATLAVDALTMAVARRGDVTGCIVHSDSKTGECQVFPGFVTLTTIGPGVTVVSEVFSQHPDPHSDRPLVVSFLGLVGCSGTPPARPAVSPEPCDSRRA